MTGDYVVRKTAGLDGWYNFTMWADSTPGNYMRIRFSDSREYQVYAEWKIGNGTIWLAQDEIGSIYETSGVEHVPSVWKFYSSSRDQQVHVRIIYWKKAPPEIY